MILLAQQHLLYDREPNPLIKDTYGLGAELPTPTPVLDGPCRKPGGICGGLFLYPVRYKSSTF